MRNLLVGEKAIADRGYKDERYFLHPDADGGDSSFCGRVRARQESLNARMKVFKVIGSKFRHELWKHIICFKAVANIVQINLKNGEPLFKIKV